MAFTKKYITISIGIHQSIGPGCWYGFQSFSDELKAPGATMGVHVSHSFTVAAPMSPTYFFFHCSALVFNSIKRETNWGTYWFIFQKRKDGLLLMFLFSGMTWDCDGQAFVLYREFWCLVRLSTTCYQRAMMSSYGCVCNPLWLCCSTVSPRAEIFSSELGLPRWSSEERLCVRITYK